MRTLLAALALAGSLTACGSDAEEAGGGLPKCADVWQVGKVLPADYAGCTDDDGKKEDAAWIDCPNGNGRYAQHAVGEHQGSEYAEAYAHESGKVIDTVGELAKICD